MASRTKVLLVDDEVQVLDQLKSFLALEGYQVLCARDGEDALRKAASFEPDVVVLDILMPEMDGREALRQLRARGDTVPVIMLTQVTGTAHRVRALDGGADDYINKPFALDELRARIEAVLRRTGAGRTDDESGRWRCCGQLRVDYQLHRAYWGKRELPLAPKEVAILEYLMRHAGELVEYDTLLEAVWGPNYIVGPGSLYENISRIRKALGDDAARPRFIKTGAGQGYCFIGRVEVLP